jgi:hypothetical protein
MVDQERFFLGYDLLGHSATAAERKTPSRRRVAAGAVLRAREREVAGMTELKAVLASIER